jgi:hypothetical protein
MRSSACVLVILLAGCAGRANVKSPPDKPIKAEDILKGKPRLMISWPASARGRQRIGVMVAGNQSYYDQMMVAMVVFVGQESLLVGFWTTNIR